MSVPDFDAAACGYGEQLASDEAEYDEAVFSFGEMAPRLRSSSSDRRRGLLRRYRARRSPRLRRAGSELHAMIRDDVVIILADNTAVTVNRGENGGAIVTRLSAPLPADPEVRCGHRVQTTVVEAALAEEVLRLGELLDEYLHEYGDIRMGP